MKKTNTLIAAATVAGLALTLSASAGTDDFGAYTVGQNASNFNPATSGITSWDGGETGNWVVANTGAPSPAGNFAGNFIDIASRDNNFSFVNANFTAVPVAAFSFDLSLGAEDGYFRLSASEGGVSTRNIDLATTAFTGGESIEYTVTAGTAMHLDLLVNESAAVVSYLGESIAANAQGLFVNGTLVWSQNSFGANTQIDRLGLWAKGNGAGNVLTAQLDNFSFTVIPEPSSYALIGGLCAMAFVMVRRRQ